MSVSQKQMQKNQSLLRKPVKAFLLCSDEIQPLDDTKR